MGILKNEKIEKRKSENCHPEAPAQVSSSGTYEGASG
jgi:hypothetical protein